jgi:hypothetical protein
MTGIKISLVSEHHHLVLNHLAGKKTICKSKNIFYFIDPDFYKDTSRVGIHTPKRTVKVLDVNLDKGQSIAEIFKVLPDFWSKKWLSQSQLTKFCKHFRAWLQVDDQPNLFLCKINEFSLVDEDNPWVNLQVVEVCVDHDDDVYVRKISYNILTSQRIKDDYFRVIIPSVHKKK